MPSLLGRRQFLAGLAGAGMAGYFVHPTPAPAKDSPNEKLRIAGIGTANRAGANLAAVAHEEIVALADIDDNFLQQAAAKYPRARTYRDFRTLLDKEAEHLDAVVVATPDHTHAPAAARAMRLKKHVYCEKPLTHTVFEARTLSELATANNLVTQMGTQIHAGDNYRRVVELVRGGAIGPIGEVHVWVDVDYSGGKFVPGQPAPKHVDWDLWLGPAAERPYSPDIHPFWWRRFWDYGTGGLGDFGCHYMDLVHWALDLRHPTSINARGSELDPVSCPSWTIVEYEYPARDDGPDALPPVKLTWYDGGRQPDLLGQLRDGKGERLNWKSGQLFVGKQGMILSNYSRHMLLPAEQFADYQRPPQSIESSIGHHREWLEAIRTGGPTTCNFDYSGALTEAVLLGVVSFRSGRRIQWDAQQMRVTNAPEAQALVHTEYRKGWEL